MTTNRTVRDRVLRAWLDARERLLSQPERGDVPGWVLITIMTVGLVGVLWGVAEGQLESMFRSALSGFRQP